MEAGGLKILSYPWLSIMFEASLDYMKPFLKSFVRELLWKLLCLRSICFPVWRDRAKPATVENVLYCPVF